MLISDASCDRLLSLVANRTGLNIHGRDMNSFRKIIQQRLAQLRLSSVEAYHQLLATTAGESGHMGMENSSPSEWQYLLTQLTVGESYFFRDHRQFSLLRNQLVPDLLHQRSVQSGAASEGSHLRIWSAGCATGEEVYSLAILVQELGLQSDLIAAEIIGTDINVEFLAKARQGCYGEWSFRQTEETLRQRYFQAQGGSYWQINPDLKRSVSFGEFNLVQDNVAQLVSFGGSFDLILCRNVFIYFTPEAIAQTLTRFYQGLKPGGYLVTGHAELQGIPLNGLQVRCFPDSIVYQRPGRSRPTTMDVTTLSQSDYAAPAQFWPREDTPPPRPMERAPQLSTTSASRLRSLSQSLSPSRTTAKNNSINPGVVPSIGRSNPAPPSTDGVSQPFVAIMQKAKQDANQGHYAQARQGCQEAIALQPFAVEPCYLLASIAEESNDLDGAKVFLKRVIYLDEMAIPAYLELAALYDRTGEGDRATKTRRSVVRILAKLPPHRTLATCNNMTVAELQTLLSRQIEEQTP